MATSGSIDFTRTRNQIVTRALRFAGVIEAGEEPAAEDMTAGAEALNALVKALQAEGYHLWKLGEATLFLTKGTASYNLGTGGDHATLSHVKTELATAASASDTSLTVDSITGIAASDNIGVVQDDDTVHWTTVNGTPTGTTVVLTAGMVSAAAIDNHIYTYTTIINRPLRITSVRRKNDADSDIPIITFSRQEYFDTPNKTTQAKTTQVYYDPQLGNGVAYLWPTPDSPNDRLTFTGAFPIEDFDASTDNPDLPQEWLNALTFALAEDLAVEYGTPDDLYARIEKGVARYKPPVMDWDVEPESVLIQPDFTMGGG